MEMFTESSSNIEDKTPPICEWFHRVQAEFGWRKSSFWREGADVDDDDLMFMCREHR